MPIGYVPTSCSPTSGPGVKGEDSMETWDAIRARRNVRSYRTDPVPAELLAPSTPPARAVGVRPPQRPAEGGAGRKGRSLQGTRGPPPRPPQRPQLPDGPGAGRRPRPHRRSRLAVAVGLQPAALGL